MLALASRTLVLSTFAGVLWIDVATKAWAAEFLTEPIRVADWLYLMLRHNSGVFLGTLPVSTGYWIGVCAAIGWFGWRALRSTSVPVAICVAVVLGGVTGNAIGQARGAVVDFVGFGPIAGEVWLVVNAADLAMVGGGLTLGFFLIWARVRRIRVTYGRAGIPPDHSQGPQHSIMPRGVHGRDSSGTVRVDGKIRVNFEIGTALPRHGNGVGYGESAWDSESPRQLQMGTQSDYAIDAVSAAREKRGSLPGSDGENGCCPKLNDLVPPDEDALTKEDST